jgi:type II secretory pathway component PulF
MIYVIPKIKPLFEKDDIDLPFATQSLIFLSDFVVNHFV